MLVIYITVKKLFYNQYRIQETQDKLTNSRKEMLFRCAQENTLMYIEDKNLNVVSQTKFINFQEVKH